MARYGAYPKARCKENRKMVFVVTNRILSYLPNPGSSARDAHGVRISSAAVRLGLTVFCKEPFVFACSEIASSLPSEGTFKGILFSPDAAGVRASVASRPRNDVVEAIRNSHSNSLTKTMVLDVFPGTSASGRHLNLNMKQSSWTEWHKQAEKEAQFYNLLELTAERFRLESDSLGIKPLYRSELSGGTIFASRLRDLISIFPELSKPIDSVALYGLLMLSSPPSDRTLHEKIRRTSTGACYGWDSQNGLRMTRERRLKAPSVDADLGMERAQDRIQAALSSSLNARTQSLKQPVILALSGGYDSRLIAAFSKELGIPINAYTYGEAHHREVYIAKLVAQTLKLNHRVIPYAQNNLLSRLPVYLETVEGQADLGTAQIANMLDLETEEGSPLLIGFLGETVAGEHLAWLKDSDFDDFNGISEGIVRGYAHRQQLDGQPFTGMELSREAYKEEVSKELRKDCHPYQSLMIWDLENRQRRYIGAHCQMLGSHFDVIAPNYDLEVIDAWFSLPRIPLMKRRFFHQLLEHCFPDLAKIPHAAEPHPIIPNLKYQLKLYGRSQFSRLFAAFGQNGKHPDIDRLWCTLTVKQEEHMVSHVVRCGDKLERMFGIRPVSGFEGMVRGKPQAVRNLFMVAKYAEWLRRGKTAVPSLPPATNLELAGSGIYSGGHA